jgi:hypothetical protein
MTAFGAKRTLAILLSRTESTITPPPCCGAAIACPGFAEIADPNVHSVHGDSRFSDRETQSELRYVRGMNPNDTPPEQQPPTPNWRAQRKSGMLVIFASAFVAVLLWLGVRYLSSPVANMDSVTAKLLFTFKCWCLAVLFCFATGIDAVAHERLQSPAFDPLLGYETKRMRVNLRYLQNTLEQLVIFTAGIFGLAIYSSGGAEMRAVEATTVVWILFRFAFWIGYHRSATMRSLGAASIGLTLIVLVYVVARISFDFGGVIGMAVILSTFSIIEAILFWTTRFRKTPSE